MRKINKAVLLITTFLLCLGSVNAAALPTGNDLPIPLSESSRGTWGNTYNNLLNNTFVILDRIFTTTGFLKTGLNISTNELNVSNDLNVLGNIKGEIPNSFKNFNWSNLYIAEANTRYSLANFTSNYDNRNDRWSLGNFTTSFANRLNENVLINGIRTNNITGEEQFLGISGSLTGIGNGSNNAKTWVIKASATRPVGSNTINGDFDDAL
ncbi:MAG: hypothetical protein AABY22_02355, partial [Nanoarchaeota archaeon]